MDYMSAFYGHVVQLVAQVIGKNWLLELRIC